MGYLAYAYFNTTHDAGVQFAYVPHPTASPPG